MRPLARTPSMRRSRRSSAHRAGAWELGRRFRTTRAASGGSAPTRAKTTGSSSRTGVQRSSPGSASPPKSAAGEALTLRVLRAGPDAPRSGARRCSRAWARVRARAAVLAAPHSLVAQRHELTSVRRRRRSRRTPAPGKGREIDELERRSVTVDRMGNVVRVAAGRHAASELHDGVGVDGANRCRYRSRRRFRASVRRTRSCSSCTPSSRSCAQSRRSRRRSRGGLRHARGS